MFLRDLLSPRLFRHRGKRYRLRAPGRRTIGLLRDVARDPGCQSLQALLRMRPRIRAVLDAPAPVALSYVVDRTNYTRATRMAIWLLGRSGNFYGTPSINRAVDHEDFRVRREAVRALKRLHAWSQLKKIQESHPDPRTRALARVAPPSPYADRLAQFVARSAAASTFESEASQSRGRTPRPDLVIAAHASLDEGSPPKEGWRIRLIVRRIRRLVRGRRRKRSAAIGGRLLGRCLRM